MNNKTQAANAGTFAASYELLIKNQQAFDVKNYKSDLDAGTSLEGKIVKLFRCFGCDKCFSAKMMSSILIICKQCLMTETFQDEGLRRRFVERTLNKFGKFARRHICQKF